MSVSARWCAGLVACASACAGNCPLLPELDGNQCRSVLALRLPAELPRARGNAYGDDESAAQFGFRLFFDSDAGHGFSCASCHLPELDFTDRLPVSHAIATGVRNAPTVFNAARLSVIFWDGRADSLWSQPLFAIENPAEMGSSRLELAHLIANDPVLRPLYVAAFGEMVDLSALPLTGKPGDSEFDALPMQTRADIDRIAANAGKALEAYMRRNSSGAAPLDAFLDGDEAAIDPVAQRGLQVFAQRGCIDCHAGPMLSDEAFHSVDLPSLPGAAHDAGRANAIAILEDNEFNLQGPFADPPIAARPMAPEPPDPDGAFRTPSLRNIESTAPYGHDGALPTLSDLLAVHPGDLSPSERAALLAFFNTLDGERPPLPWSNWPSRL